MLNVESGNEKKRSCNVHPRSESKKQRRQRKHKRLLTRRKSRREAGGMSCRRASSRASHHLLASIKGCMSAICQLGASVTSGGGSSQCRKGKLQQHREVEGLQQPSKVTVALEQTQPRSDVGEGERGREPLAGVEVRRNPAIRGWRI